MAESLLNIRQIKAMEKGEGIQSVKGKYIEFNCLFHFRSFNNWIPEKIQYIRGGKTTGTLFQIINFGIDDTSSSERTLSTASICCSARGWLHLTVVYNKIQLFLIITELDPISSLISLYLISTTCTKSDDSDISSSVALNAATYRERSTMLRKIVELDIIGVNNSH